MKYLFVFDVDFTLTNDQGEILPETIKVLKELKSKGHRCAIATGRPFYFVDQKRLSKYFDYVISSNGAVITKIKNHQILSYSPLDTTTVNSILSVTKDLDIVTVIHTKSESPFVLYNQSSSTKNTFPNFKRLIDLGYTKKTLNDLTINNNVVQVTLKPSDIEADVLHSLLINHNLTNGLTRSKNRIFDFKSKTIDKFSAIKTLQSLEQLNDYKIISFGDSMNDFEMIKNSFIGIAMSNSEEKLKSIASTTIGSNNVPSIANKIKELL